MKNLYTTIIFFILQGFICVSYTQSIWKQLADVKFKTQKKEGYEIDFPIFGTKVKALAGKTIILKGYIIPLAELDGQNYFVFSAYPYNLCYFCGGAGPETVMEVYTKKTIPYTSKPIKIQGKLKLNANDPDRLMYILENAKQIN